MRWILVLAVALSGWAVPALAAPGEPVLLAQRGKRPKPKTGRKVRRKNRRAGLLDKAVQRRFKATSRTLRQARARVKASGQGLKTLRKAMVAQFAARRALAKGNRKLARRLTGKAQRLARKAMSVARLRRAPAPSKASGGLKAKGRTPGSPLGDAEGAKPVKAEEAADARARGVPSMDAREADSAGAPPPAMAPAAQEPKPKRKAKKAIAGDDEEAIAGDDEEAIAGDDEEAIAGDDEEAIAGDDEEAIAAVNAAEGEVPAEGDLLDDDAAFDALDQPSGQ